MMFFQQVLPKLCGAFVLSAIPLSLVTGLPTGARATSLSSQNFDNKIYVFGDSLSDNGNVFKADGGTYPSSPPYYQGRFSNGPVWVEDLATDLGATSTDFAFGGASTGSGNVSIPNLPVSTGLQAQVSSFTAATPSADPKALYIVWAGANDYLFGGVTDPTVPVNNLSKAVSSLADHGAKNIMVVNLPDLGKLPPTRGNIQTSSALSSLTSAHNSGLATNLNLLSRNNINIIPLDVNSLFNRALANPGDFGFNNVTDSCLVNDVVCANPNEYLFWDGSHPTAAGHEQIANLAFSALEPASVPEPPYELGTLAFGTYGIFLVLKRKQKKSAQ